jgi:hypothetical protein
MCHLIFEGGASSHDYVIVTTDGTDISTLVAVVISLP